MKLLKYSLLLTLFSCFGISLQAFAYDVDKVIEKSFPIKADGTFDISNKYGSVDILEWDKNEISIKVTITVKTTNQRKADEIFDRIDIKFNNSSSYVSAETEIESKRSWFGWMSWSGSNYEIDYDIKMPQSVHLKCKNKYGDTFITDLNNGAEIEIKYGNLKLGSVEGESSIDVGYGNIDFGDLGDLRLEAKYSNIKGSSAQNVDMDSKYSILDFGDLRSLNCDTKHDEITIDKVLEIDNDGAYDTWDIDDANSFESDTRYTSIKIDNLEGGLKVDQSYGTIEIDKLSCTSADIDLELRYTDVRIDTDDCGDMEVDYEGEHTGLNLFDDLEDQVSRDGNNTRLNAEFGSRALKMKIRMNYGGLKLQ